MSDSQESAALTPASTYKEGGRGRKQCPACQQYVGARATACPCGHQFAKPDKSDKPEKPAKEKSEPAADKPAAGPSSSLGRGCMAIFTPAGPCPAKLEGSDPDTVAAWVASVRAHFDRQNKFLRYEGLRYFVGHFYDPGTPEYREAAANVKAVCQAELQSN